MGQLVKLEPAWVLSLLNPYSKNKWLHLIIYLVISMVSYIFDGTTGSMPDTDENRDYFHKPSSQKGQAGFPLVRIMALLAYPVRLVVKVAYAPYSGKGTGERTLVMQILESVALKDALFLLDAGLYSFKLIYTILQKDGHFLIKVPSNFTVKIIKKLADGSYIAIVSGKILDPDAKPRSDGKNSWKKVEITVRLIRYQIPGFKTVTLVVHTSAIPIKKALKRRESLMLLPSSAASIKKH